ncbi:MAG: HD domain-containing protein [Eubacteriales bacterium]|nr:HD domain-containing protein [Eubacteriales bacterium]
MTKNNDDIPETAAVPSRNGSGQEDIETALKKAATALSPEEEKDFRALIADIASDPRTRQMEQFKQHGSTNTYEHCLSVARCAFGLARHLHLSVDERVLITAALLHDYCLYDWHGSGDHLHGFHHPYIAADNAIRDFGIPPEAADAIRSHMWPLNLTQFPNSMEAWLITTADKICAARESIFRG